MSNSVVILFNTINNNSSVLSWKMWCEKYNHIFYTVDYDINNVINKYFLSQQLDQQDINYNSVLLVNDTTIITPHCENFIKDLDKITYAQWFGPYGNLFEILSLFNSKLSVDNWINPDVLFLPKIELKKLETKLNDVKFLKTLEQNQDKLSNYNEIFDIPINLIDRDVSSELQLSYFYNTCNMQINELLTDDLKFTKLNPFIVNFNGMNKDHANYFLNKTFNHYYE